MKYKGDLVITDPCYFTTHDDWEKSDYGNELENINFGNYITIPTGFGDGVGAVFEGEASVIDGLLADSSLSLNDLINSIKEKCKSVGQFCVDSGQFGIYNRADIDSLKEKDKDWDKWTQGGSTTHLIATVIENFDGDIECITKYGNENPQPDEIIYRFKVNMLVLRESNNGHAFIAIPGL